MKKRFYIYKITFLKGSLKGKYYIGKKETYSADIINDGYFGSGHIPHKYYKKYPAAIGETITKEILEECENKAQLSEREKFWIDDLWKTDEKCVNMRRGGEGGWDFITQSYWKGKHLSDEHKRKLSNANKNRQSPMKGKHLSDDTKRKISIASKSKTHSKETKEKIGKSHIGNSYAKGRIHINNGSQNKMVKPELLDQYLSEGWVLGRLPLKRKAAKQAA